MFIKFLISFPQYTRVFFVVTKQIFLSLAVFNRSNKKLDQLKKLDLLSTSDHDLLVV